MKLMFLAVSSEVTLTITILLIILLVLLILLSIYAALTFKKVANAAKKVDYFFEDLTYKSEMLNSTVETVAKVTNYVEVLDAFSKRNIKSWVKVATKNKDVVYKLVDKLREFANSDEEK